MLLKNKAQLPEIESFKDDNIKIMALGGLGEVGKNMYVVEIDDEIIIIDSGILFPDNDYGIDYIIPDYTYLKINQEKIIGLFITHGHEDHIGGIPSLLKDVPIKAVYATGLAVSLIKSKVGEAGVDINLIEYNSNSIYKFKNFEVSFFKTNHSIPDSHGIALKTRLGYILHTGDFKIDLTPLSNQTDFEKIADYAKNGVLCLLSDSTNANVTKFTTSEKRIGDNIRSIFSTIKGRIIIATFASNVYRVQQIVEASVENNRKVIFFGRSMEKCINVAQKLNYIKTPSNTFINSKEFDYVKPEHLTILSTGSQGEPLAALSRIADGSHRKIKIIPGDTIVFSSSAIPGNQESINRTINKLYKAGANVIVNSPLTDTHTSGHASEKELQIMLVLTKPKYFMPIHGEFSMQKRHAELAVETGIPKENCFILKNGEVLTITPDRAFCNYCVPFGNTYIDSGNAEIDGNVIKERKLMGDDGIVSLVFKVRDDLSLIGNVSFFSRGFVYMKESEKLITNIRKKAASLYSNYLKRNPKATKNQLHNFIVFEMSNFISQLTDRKPIILPSILICK